MTHFRLIGRLLRRQGIYGFMSIFGLGVGLTVALFALLYVWQETHYDAHVPNAERVHLVDLRISWPDRAVVDRATTPGGLGPMVMRDVAGIEAVTRVRRQYSTVNVPDGDDFNEIFAAADPNFASLMGLDLVAGTADALTDPTQILISESFSQRLFGRPDALDETVTVDGSDMRVGGIFRDWPRLSHMDFDTLVGFAAPFVRLPDDIDNQWDSVETLFTYLVLKDGVNTVDLARRTEEIFNTNLRETEEIPGGLTLDDVIELGLVPLSEVHLNGKRYPFGIKPPADRFKLAVLSAIAVVIVLIACINYINIATVTAVARAREVAVRKLMGAGRARLMRQFLLEAAVLSTAALLFAFVCVELFAEPVGALLDAELDAVFLLQPQFLAWVFGLMLFVTLAAGFYPALLASRYRPGRLLAEHGQGRSGGSLIRSGLVIFQFSVSIILAIVAAVIWNQLSFVRSADLGFEADNVVMLYGVRRSPRYTIELTSRIDKSISGRPGIQSVSGAVSSPSWDYVPEADIRLTADSPENAQTIGRVSVDLDFFETLGIEPLAGRAFSDAYGIDRAEWDIDTRDDTLLPIVLNEQAVRSLGFASNEAAVGQTAQVFISSAKDRTAEIVGVVPDVHFESLRSVIQPMIYYPDPSIFNLMMVRIDPAMREAAEASIRDGWSEVMTSQAISSDYLSTALAQNYDAERRELKTVGVLAGIGILIAVVGQFGLAAFSAEARKREVSIRKVLGARIRDIIRLFLWQFSRPVFAAIVLAWPVAFLLANAWLERFVYRIPIDPVWFVVIALAALAVALVAVSGHVLAASRARPVDALRHE